MSEVTTGTVGGQVGGAAATGNGNQAGQNGQRAGQGTPQGVPQGAAAAGQGKQTFSQEELDRRIQQALETAKGKWETGLAERIQQERDDAARLAAMSEKEKAEELARRQKENFDTQKADFERQKSIFDAQKQLAQKGLPLEFAESVARATPEETAQVIEAFYTQYNASIQAGVEEKMKGTAPKVGGGQPSGGSSDFMSIIRENQRV